MNLNKILVFQRFSLAIQRENAACLSSSGYCSRQFLLGEHLLSGNIVNSFLEIHLGTYSIKVYLLNIYNKKQPINTNSISEQNRKN